MNTLKNLRIMTYNLRNNCDVSPNSWAERKKLILELFLRESPDIIGTQECVYEQIQDMDEMLPDYDAIGLGRNGGSKGEYTAIYFKKQRFKVLEYDHFWLSDMPETIASSSWGNDVTRMVTWIRFLDMETNQQYYHLNTHLDHISENARKESANLIIKKIANFNPELLVLVTGDFNTGANTEPYKVLMEQGKLIDAWDTATGRINEGLGTFNNFNDPTGGIDRIDWILYRGDVKPGVIQIVNDQPQGQFPSDHFPVMMDLKIPMNRE
ncbi:endonuclease/exonuclease/phosphatase family protein [Sporosarcina sp. E16_3]|uniref:endonuclease/exonuclease/phosphatase family protein n=1 Tax=Sporosarcina sp. E16_3 TaxID=2789293 RepID=UPI001A910CFF|nr:endonuclease/exonuclease/phosphatase family protein [Sporosarcina sp. E16_3]MBO0600646.1 endonuclease/exonuclease/phosphatase family protein [Sporosarcina sp. E16_3]